MVYSEFMKDCEFDLSCLQKVMPTGDAVGMTASVAAFPPMMTVGNSRSGTRAVGHVCITM